jgi:hypothetical protein
MSHHRQNPHHALRDAIDQAGSTPCMDCPEVFFPEDFPDKHTKTYAIQVARALCETCPVKKECFSYAKESNERYGIWAGTLPSER